MREIGRVDHTGCVVMLLSRRPDAKPVELSLDPSDAVFAACLELSAANPVPLPAFLTGSAYDPDAAWTPPFTLVFKGRIVEVTNVSVALTPDAARTEATLRVKKFILGKERELRALRMDVAALEAVADPQGKSRAPISREVKEAVFVRDAGRCLECGATSELQFDHIIPVSKGGGNAEANIQLLCATCNLRKSDQIA
ncbi:MAG TPA: HNH endonuclease [Acidobacteriaceae bacterium]